MPCGNNSKKEHVTTDDVKREFVDGRRILKLNADVTADKT